MSESDERTYCLSATPFKTSDLKKVDGWSWPSQYGSSAEYCDDHAWDRGPFAEQLAILDKIRSCVDPALTNEEKDMLTQELTNKVWSWADGLPVEMPQLLEESKGADSVEKLKIDQLWKFLTEKERPAKVKVWCDGGYKHEEQH